MRNWVQISRSPVKSLAQWRCHAAVSMWRQEALGLAGQPLKPSFEFQNQWDTLSHKTRWTHSPCPSHETRGLLQKRGQKDCKSQRFQTIAAKQCFPHKAGPLHMNSQHLWLPHAQDLCKIKPVKTPTGWKKDSQSAAPADELLAIDSYYGGRTHLI